MRYIDIIRTLIRNASEKDIPALDWDEQQKHLGMIKARIDDVEIVVRCKDCIHSRVYGKTTQWLACENVMEGQATDPNGYCDLGKRKNNAVEESEAEE